MKKWMALLLALLLGSSGTLTALAEAGTPPAGDAGTPPTNDGGTPPEMPDGAAPGEMPAGAQPEGTPPEMPSGEAGAGGPGAGGPGGAPGGQSGQPDSYTAAYTVTEDTTLEGGTYDSTGTDENAILVQSGDLTMQDVTVTRESGDSTGGDASSFYGVGAAVLAAGGTAHISGGTVTTDSAGGAGIFAYGDAVVWVQGTTIETTQDTSGGIHVAGGGTLYAKDLTVSTAGESSAAIRSDRGSGTMVVDGGSYTATGVGSPAVYVTADISIHDADLTATGSEALCLEGLNTVRLFGCDLSGAMQDLDQNDNTWTVILYQSMSGDSQVGEGKFEMVGGTLTSSNGGLFYTTNTESEFVLSGVTITAEDGAYFLRCTGNSNQRGWGQSGSNGAQCVFTAISQEMTGDVLWDSISDLALYVIGSSRLTGAVLDDESCAGDGGSGGATLQVDATSTWVVTADSVVTTLRNEGSIVDAEGRTVTIQSTDGTVFVQGDSDVTVTCGSYETACDLSQAGQAEAWSDYSVAF